MMAHVMEECAKTWVICKRCKSRGIRESIDQHNCANNFLDQERIGDADSFRTALSEMQSQFDGKLSNF